VDLGLEGKVAIVTGPGSQRRSGRGIALTPAVAAAMKTGLERSADGRGAHIDATRCFVRDARD
jgi:hypothetical protein